MKKVSQLALALALSGLSSAAVATSFGYSPWYARVQGTVQDQGRAVDVRDELGYSNSASHGFLIDDGWLRLTYTPLKFSGTGVLADDVTYGNVTFSGDATIHSKADITDMGARFLWNVWGGLDAGFTIKVLDGEFVLTDDDGQSEKKTVSEAFPELSIEYKHDVFDLFRLGMEANYLGYEDQWVLELGAAVELATEHVRLRFGWHQKEYDLSDGDSALDTKTKGLFGQLIFDL